MLPERLSTRLRDGDEVFAVSGASGWLGMATLDVLWSALGAQAHGRVLAFASRARTLELRDGTRVACRPLHELAECEAPVTHVLHHAYLTRDRAEQASYVEANLALSLTVLRALDRHPVRGLFLPSSGAVYDAGGGLETDLATNPYGALKRLDELAFRRACADRGAACVVARVFNVAGPYMTKPHLYALGDLIAAAANGRPLVVRAPMPVRRSYVAATDVVALGIAGMLDDAEERDQVWDTASDVVVELAELAERVRGVLGRPELPVERAVYDPDAPPSDYFGDPRAMRALADRQGIELLGLDAQIEQTAAGLGARLEAVGS